MSISDVSKRWNADFLSTNYDKKSGNFLAEFCGIEIDFIKKFLR